MELRTCRAPIVSADGDRCRSGPPRTPPSLLIIIPCTIVLSTILIMQSGTPEISNTKLATSALDLDSLGFLFGALGLSQAHEVRAARVGLELGNRFRGPIIL